MMTDDAQNVGLMALIVDGVTHGFAVNGQAFVLLRVALVPALEGSVQRDGIDPDQEIADNRFAGDAVAALLVAAAEAPPGMLAKALGPIGDGPVPAHSTEAGCGRKREHRGQSMPSPLGATGIRDLGKKVGERFHLSGFEFHLRPSCPIGCLQKRPAQEHAGIGP